MLELSRFRPGPTPWAGWLPAAWSPFWWPASSHPPTASARVTPGTPVTTDSADQSQNIDEATGRQSLHKARCPARRHSRVGRLAKEKAFIYLFAASSQLSGVSETDETQDVITKVPGSTLWSQAWRCGTHSSAQVPSRFVAIGYCLLILPSMYSEHVSFVLYPVFFQHRPAPTFMPFGNRTPSGHSQEHPGPSQHRPF